MKIAQLITAYNEAVFDTDRNRALQLIHDAVSNGFSPEEVVFEVVVPALEQMVTSISQNMELNLAQYFIISPMTTGMERLVAAINWPSPRKGVTLWLR